MPYSDREAQREYQREWWTRRRREWIEEHGPCVDCNGSVDLEVDHDDASAKVTHRVWSWSAKRREAELAKCVVRCHACHMMKSTMNRDRGFAPSKLSFDQVTEIRRRRAAGESAAALADEYGISARYVRNIVAGDWRTIA